MLREGTKIVKCCSAPGDGHQDGAKGKIVKIVPIPEDKRAAFLTGLKENMKAAPVPEGYSPEALYFVEWDDVPGLPVGIADYRIKEDI